MTTERVRMLSFVFVGPDIEASREPAPGSEAVKVSASGGKGESFDLGKLDSGMVHRLALYGLKQKLSDYRTGDKAEMADVDARLDVIRECYAMLAAGDWEREREGRVAVPPTVDEAVAAIAALWKAAGQPVDLDAIRTAIEGQDLSTLAKPVLDIVSANRKLARATATVGKGTDLTAMFKK